VLAINAFSQWQATQLPSQNWPSSDVKSYNNKLYVSGNSGVFSSTDNGSTWNDLTQGFAANSSSSFREMVFTSSGEIFVRTTTSGVVKSMDSGATWQLDTAGIGLNGVNIIYYDATSNRIFASLGWPNYGLYYKTPSDMGWTRITGNGFANNFSPVQITGNSGSIYVIDQVSKIYKSTDGGNTWIMKNSIGLPQAETSLGASRFIIVGGNLFLAHGGVYKSANDGDTWTRMDYGFALSYNLFVYSTGLFYDGTNLISSVYEKKTYFSPDLGVTWNLMGTSSAPLISFAKHNGNLYAAGFGKDSLYVFNGNIGLSEFENDSYNLFPMPFTSNLNIVSENYLNDANAEIFNSNGTKVIEIKNINGNSFILKKGDLVQGIYFLNLKEKGKIILNKKIIID
jgi:photosystem II stability/assembly factor-like uncharacterized protein